MKRDEVIRMAREAGAYIYGEKEVKDIMLTPESIEHFAALVAQQEREECANMLRDAADIIDPKGKRTNQVDRHTAEVLHNKSDEIMLRRKN